MARVDSLLRVHEANQEFCRQFGTSDADARGARILDFIHRSGHGNLQRQLARVLDGRCGRVSEQVLGVAAGSSVFTGQLTAVAVDEAGLGGDLAIMFVPDVTPVANDVVTDGKKVLTVLDARILEGIAAGLSTVRLASKCYLSRQGVEYRVGMMLRRLRVPNRTALVSRAYAMGMISVGAWPPQVLADYVE
jgi:DNA-binding CsgD family transcriptional regulator